MTDREEQSIDRQKEFSGTSPVRKGFELDIDSLQKYMQKHVEGFSGTVALRQFKGGQSNPTYHITAGGKQYVLRRKPSGKLLKSAHAVDREYKVITALGQTNVPVARTYALCTDASIIGSWFYIMAYVDGRIFWTYADIPREERPAIFKAMNTTMANLHQVDYKAVGLEDYGKAGDYFSRQISRWSKQYLASVEERSAAMDDLMEWLLSNIPENDETTIVHGDYRVDNMIFHPTEPKILAVLDWELSTLGHPLSDFAYHCIIWRIPAGDWKGLAGIDLNARNYPTEEAYMKTYCRRTEITSIENWNYYMAFNFFRLAGISFGIKGRLRDGTAASKHARASADAAEPLAQFGLNQI
ncbi:MAG: phosphotransferase family protein [Deltaproteobacteria bacterium]|nr:phosphotransferase family protein [Deltaproteobacteria bacterium]